METCTESAKVCCYGCLCDEKENKLKKYNLKNGPLQIFFQVNTIRLCYLCGTLAKKFTKFIENVQHNQLLLTSMNNLMDANFQKLKGQYYPMLKLTQHSLHSIELIDSGKDVEECHRVLTNTETLVGVKFELKLEDAQEVKGDLLEENNDFTDDYLKEEDDFPLTELLKEDVSMEEIDMLDLKDALKENDVCQTANSHYLNQVTVELSKKDKPQDSNLNDPGVEKIKVSDKTPIERIILTTEQYMDERIIMCKDREYLHAEFKCENCIKCFENKLTYERHMEEHSESAGKFMCDFCGIRKETRMKLAKHKDSHFRRYICNVCGQLHNTRAIAKAHYSTHFEGMPKNICPQCQKIFKNATLLRKHVWYAHKRNRRVICAHCQKTYATKDVLKTHIMMKHAAQTSGSEQMRKYVCVDCGSGFRSPSHLKKHSLKHTHRKDYYCVECDKCFKSEESLKQHYKTALPHANYITLRHPCEYCSKRFAVKRDLEKHTNRMHLHLKPYQCDLCEKAYASSCALKEHKRKVHEGVKPLLKYPCPYCHKAFRQSHVLKSHIRTHTGERPFQCSKCPAQFSQSSILNTHVKLIHLRLTRDGKPKALIRK